MSKWVLDSSAILAALQGEPGAERVEAVIGNSQASAVNIAEVFTKLAEAGQLNKHVLDDFYSLGIEIIDFDTDQARKTAELRPVTKHLGLSLGDRSCLALAMLTKATAVTADGAWKKITFCKVDVIR
ncbi:MAG TPA: VapC toxin family PIN domain ribonuclease [Blastocatellia bacterium]|nr:VapC toxin family PIN domain ribonuclease [Blastocatellia bacterium]